MKTNKATFRYKQLSLIRSTIHLLLSVMTILQPVCVMGMYYKKW